MNSERPREKRIEPSDASSQRTAWRPNRPRRSKSSAVRETGRSRPAHVSAATSPAGWPEARFQTRTSPPMSASRLRPSLEKPIPSGISKLRPGPGSATRGRARSSPIAVPFACQRPMRPQVSPSACPGQAMGEQAPPNSVHVQRDGDVARRARLGRRLRPGRQRRRVSDDPAGRQIIDGEPAGRPFARRDPADHAPRIGQRRRQADGQGLRRAGRQINQQGSRLVERVHDQAVIGDPAQRLEVAGRAAERRHRPGGRVPQPDLRARVRRLGVRRPEEEGDRLAVRRDRRIHRRLSAKATQRQTPVRRIHRLDEERRGRVEPVLRRAGQRVRFAG